MQATATAQNEQEREAMSAPRTNGGVEIVDAIPKLLDKRGEIIPSAHPTIMARVDAKASEKVELSRGTLWLLATLLVLGGVVFSYGSSIIGWARDDESQRVKMANIERQVEELNNKFDDLG